MENYQYDLNSAFHALADPTRRAVIARLIAGDASVKELAEPFAMGLPTLLKHLKVLEDSGLIHSTKTGRVRTCSIRLERLAEAESWLTQQRQQRACQLDQFADYVESLAQAEKKT